MCDPYELKAAQDYRRREAARRHQRANKCDVLQLIDREIERGGAIYDVLERVVHRIDTMNAGAGDTAKALLRLEGWRE